MSETGIQQDTGNLDLNQELVKQQAMAENTVKVGTAVENKSSESADKPSLTASVAAGAEVLSHAAGLSPTLAVGAAVVVDFIGAFKQQAQEKKAQFQSTFGPFMVADNRQKKTAKAKRQNDGFGPLRLASESLNSPSRGVTVHPSPQTIQMNHDAARMVSAIRQKQSRGPVITENILDGNQGYLPQDAVNTLQDGRREATLQRFDNHS